jgi:hypothetical protein
MKWNELSIKDKSEAMRIAVSHGVYDLDDIRNKFEEGGDLYGGGKIDPVVVSAKLPKDYFDKLAEKAHQMGFRNFSTTDEFKRLTPQQQGELGEAMARGAINRTAPYLAQPIVEIATGFIPLRSGFNLTAKVINKISNSIKTAKSKSAVLNHAVNRVEEIVEKVRPSERGINVDEMLEAGSTGKRAERYGKLTVKDPSLLSESDQDLITKYIKDSDFIQPKQPAYNRQAADQLEKIVVGNKGNTGTAVRQLSDHSHDMKQLGQLNIGDTYTPGRHTSWAVSPRAGESVMHGNNRLVTTFDEKLSTLPTERYQYGHIGDKVRINGVKPNNWPVLENEIVLPRKLNFGIEDIVENSHGGKDYIVKILNPYTTTGTVAGGAYLSGSNYDRNK